MLFLSPADHAGVYLSRHGGLEDSYTENKKLIKSSWVILYIINSMGFVLRSYWANLHSVILGESVLTHVR